MSSSIKTVSPDDVEIGSELAHGGFCVVRNAWFKGMSAVAKVYRCKDPYTLADDEAKVANTLGRIITPQCLAVFHNTHPKYPSDTITIFEHGGVSLGKYMAQKRERGPLPKEFLYKLLQYCYALVHQAHSLSLLHGDLSPNNFLVVEVEGELIIRLIDFGASKFKDPDLTHASTVNAVGTPAYASPDLLRKRRTEEGDMFSLASVIYYLSTGNLPFPSIASIQRCVIPTRSGLPKRFFRVLKAMWSGASHEKLSHIFKEYRLNSGLPFSSGKISEYIDRVAEAMAGDIEPSAPGDIAVPMNPSAPALTSALAPEAPSQAIMSSSGTAGRFDFTTASQFIQLFSTDDISAGLIDGIRDYFDSSSDRKETARALAEAMVALNGFEAEIQLRFLWIASREPGMKSFLFQHQALRTVRALASVYRDYPSVAHLSLLTLCNLITSNTIQVVSADLGIEFVSQVMLRHAQNINVLTAAVFCCVALSNFLPNRSQIIETKILSIFESATEGCENQTYLRALTQLKAILFNGSQRPNTSPYGSTSGSVSPHEMSATSRPSSASSVFLSGVVDWLLVSGFISKYDRPNSDDLVEELVSLFGMERNFNLAVALSMQSHATNEEEGELQTKFLWIAGRALTMKNVLYYKGAFRTVRTIVKQFGRDNVRICQYAAGTICNLTTPNSSASLFEDGAFRLIKKMLHWWPNSESLAVYATVAIASLSQKPENREGLLAQDVDRVFYDLCRLHPKNRHVTAFANKTGALLHPTGQ